MTSSKVVEAHGVHFIGRKVMILSGVGRLEMVKLRFASKYLVFEVKVHRRCRETTYCCYNAEAQRYIHILPMYIAIIPH
jgi:hypothetical protein